MRRRGTAIPALFLLVALGQAHAQDARPGAPPLTGAWSAEEYVLADGTTHRVSGRIFFTGTEWTVLFFVMDGDEPGRGSAEGGTYTLQDDRLVFSHRYNLSAGEAMPGLDASPLRMTVRDAGGEPTEPCRIELSGTSLTIRFPSGNAMRFRRSSAF